MTAINQAAEGGNVTPSLNAVQTNSVIPEDDSVLWNQSFGFDEALLSCDEDVLSGEKENKENLNQQVNKSEFRMPLQPAPQTTKTIDRQQLAGAKTFHNDARPLNQQSNNINPDRRYQQY
ncbi:uncharacterized protein LOC110243042, partial [Exaiptasia diaphana]|uniref:Uncharacterized protein n=1 Tax=Exaiptasia diaphana TaxID=2652724 RepID=A0A913XI13_EXADI